MYFYQGDKEINQYICEYDLWCLGRIIDLYSIDSHKKEKMLQPLWRRFDERIEGISIFYSKIEALFYATYLNEQFRENWDVYPLDDFNIVEMIQHNKKHKNRDY
ncbi:TPA: hypothetical protein OPR14_000088 [Citrobacter koseri]|nr:hypothetical protein [Citrobacter koseri]